MKDGIQPFNCLACVLLAATLSTGTLHAANSDESVAPPPEAEEQPAAATHGNGSGNTESEPDPGMHIPLDGSSLEAFDASLELIKKKSTAKDYTSLVNSIDYLLIYDLSARHDRARLAANLNGMTGKEVIEQVDWRRKGKKQEGNRKSQGEDKTVKQEESQPGQADQ